MCIAVPVALLRCLLVNCNIELSAICNRQAGSLLMFERVAQVQFLLSSICLANSSLSLGMRKSSLTVIGRSDAWDNLAFLYPRFLDPLLQIPQSPYQQDSTLRYLFPATERNYTYPLPCISAADISPLEVHVGPSTVRTNREQTLVLEPGSDSGKDSISANMDGKKHVTTACTHCRRR